MKGPEWRRMQCEGEIRSGESVREEKRLSRARTSQDIMLDVWRFVAKQVEIGECFVERKCLVKMYQFSQTKEERRSKRQRGREARSEKQKPPPLVHAA